MEVKSIAIAINKPNCTPESRGAPKCFKIQFRARASFGIFRLGGIGWWTVDFFVGKAGEKIRRKSMEHDGYLLSTAIGVPAHHGFFATFSASRDREYLPKHGKLPALGIQPADHPIREFVTDPGGITKVSESPLYQWLIPCIIPMTDPYVCQKNGNIYHQYTPFMLACIPYIRIRHG